MKRFIGILTVCLGLAVAQTGFALPAPRPSVEIAASEVSINVKVNGVEIEVADDATHQVTVYAITGQVVKQFTVESGTTAVELPAGCYIVRVDGLSKRVVVR